MRIVDARTYSLFFIGILGLFTSVESSAIGLCSGAFSSPGILESKINLPPFAGAPRLLATDSKGQWIAIQDGSPSDSHDGLEVPPPIVVYDRSGKQIGEIPLTAGKSAVEVRFLPSEGNILRVHTVSQTTERPQHDLVFFAISQGGSGTSGIRRVASLAEELQVPIFQIYPVTDTQALIKFYRGGSDYVGFVEPGLGWDYSFSFAFLGNPKTETLLRFFANNQILAASLNYGISPQPDQLVARSPTQTLVFDAMEGTLIIVPNEIPDFVRGGRPITGGERPLSISDQRPMAAAFYGNHQVKVVDGWTGTTWTWSVSHPFSGDLKEVDGGYVGRYSDDPSAPFQGLVYFPKDNTHGRDLVVPTTKLTNLQIERTFVMGSTGEPDGTISLRVIPIR